MELEVGKFLKNERVVGAERFELPTLWSQTRCASQTALRPEIKFIEKKI